MADLNAYINFNVVLDKSGSLPVITLSDSGAYPSGVAPTVTGVFSITQPDGITVTGSFAPIPDVSYVSSAFTTATKELRLASDGNFQKGLYIITYTVHSPSYMESVLTKSFSLYYERPTLIITDSFDVFTPSLKVYDSTNYSIATFNAPTITRSWSAVLENVGVINSSADVFDLLLNSNYYDAKYAVTLTSTLLYTFSGASWAAIKDNYFISDSYVTEVPASLNELYSEITAYKSKIKDSCCIGGNEQTSNYMYAFTLFQHFMMRGKCGAIIKLREMVDEIQMILNNGADPIYEVSNKIIPAYSFTNFCGISNTSSTPLVSSNSETIIEFEIGSGSGYTVTDNKTKLHILDSNMAHKLISKTLVSLYIEGTRVPLTARTGTVYASFDTTTGIITLNNGGLFSNQAYIVINYK